jgi:hypothetical protein
VSEDRDVVRPTDLKPRFVDVLLLGAAILFLTLALMQLAKGPLPDNPAMPPPSNSAVW